jgi:16S rRNA (cytosine967-C5)-methyltransferase
MAVSPARAAAYEILQRVEREQSYASELLHSARFNKLSSADHGLATELVMGVLRWRSWLDQRLAEASSQNLERLDEEVLGALRLGLYQLKFLSRVPARAAIFESVELVRAARKRSAASFVNAVLRKTAATAATASAEPAAGIFSEIEKSSDAIVLARNSAHPEWLVARWVERYGIETTRQICLADQHPPATCIHVYDRQGLDELTREGVNLGPSRLLSAAQIVVAGDITRTRAYEQGHVAIQDAGSQLVALLVGPGKTILDCCAAPGGKTALLARRNPAALVVASELHPHRARLLRDRVSLPNVRIVAGDARQFPFSRTFDRILADVPCSGTGTLARNPEIKWRLRSEDLDDLQKRQVAILKSALGQLAAGGRLIYSTCSMEREENEAVVDAALDELPEFSIIDCRGEHERLHKAGDLSVEGIETLLDGPYLRTIPGPHPCDGFFAAIIQRN